MLEAVQSFYAGVSRSREIDHDSNLYATFRQEEARLRDEPPDLEIRRVILEAVLDGRVVVSGPRQRNHPDFPLRGFVRCDVCGRPLTGSWSKGRNGHYAYYHCQRQCRAVNVSKATLEGAFVDELALLQPTPGYMRLVKDRILHVWDQRRSDANERTTEQERRVKAIQQKLDRLDEAFLYSKSIDLTSYGRQRDKPREEFTLAKIEHHTEAVDELDVQGMESATFRIWPVLRPYTWPLPTFFNDDSIKKFAQRWERIR